MERYCSYIRVSTKQQGISGLGLEAQRSLIKHFYPDCDREFLEVKSGKDIINRPILQEAIKFCKENNYILVTAKVDRLTRDCENGLAIIRELNGAYRSCDLPGIPDRFMVTLYFAFAEREKMLIAIRTKEGLNKSKKLKGVHAPIGNRIAWSDQVRESSIAARKSKSLNNPDRNKARQLAIALKDTDTLESIAAKLNSSGFSTPSGNGAWSKGQVYRLVK